MAAQPDKADAESLPSPSAPNKVFIRKDPQRWKRAGWTSVPNSILHDPEMPPEEIWAWSWFASHNGTFELNAKALADANKHIGRDKAYALVQRLEERGLLLRGHVRGANGVPCVIYDLQPTPVPPEERTAKPKRAAAKSKRAHPGSKASSRHRDSVLVRNAGVTSTDDAPPSPGFLTGQEPGPDQHIPDPSGEGHSPDGSVPDGSGESYKEDKTKEQKNQPTKTKGASCGPEGAGDFGWSAPSELEDTDPAVTLLRSLQASNGEVLAEHAITTWKPFAGELVASYSPSRLASFLTDGANSAGFIVHKLRQLHAQHNRPAAAPVQSTGSAAGAWCGDTDCDPRTRMREFPTGAVGRCPCFSGQVPAIEQKQQAEPDPALVVSGTAVLSELGLTPPA